MAGGERKGGRENKASVTAARREWAARAAAGGIKRDYWTILSAIYETDMFRRRGRPQEVARKVPYIPATWRGKGGGEGRKEEGGGVCLA